MNWLKNIIIEIQRYSFRRKFRRSEKQDETRKLKAIDRANARSKKGNIRLWVIRLSPGNFGVYTKSEAKALFRSMYMAKDVNLYQTNDFIIHITKKIHEV